MSNQNDRVDFPIDLVQGPIPGSTLLETFKTAIIQERVFKLMFGDQGERIFIKDLPSLNETILPCIMAYWRQDQYKSNTTYLEGSIKLEIILPVRLRGDFNSLRRVATIFQRWLGSGNHDLYSSNKGLIGFGFDSSWNYESLAKLDAVAAPAIVANLPFRFDLALLRNDYDPTMPLDESDLEFIEGVTATIFDEETERTLTVQEATIDNS